MRKRNLLLLVLLLLTVALAGCVEQPSEPENSVQDTGGGDTSTSTDTPESDDGTDTSSDTPSDTSENSAEVVVTHVTDGDTFDIQYPNGTEDTVRLLGVDTPEVYSEVSPEEFAGANAECLERATGETRWLRPTTSTSHVYPKATSRPSPQRSKNMSLSQRPLII
jgi:hypothetical protein